MTTQNKWQTDVDGFIQAVNNDEYAEIVLEHGDVLISDTEMDGEYYPYVEPIHKEHEKHDIDEYRDRIAIDIEQKFDVEVTYIEWDERNEVFVPYMDRPQ